MREDDIIENALIKVFGPILKKNLEMKLSQEDISEKAGITQAAISRILNLKSIPKFDSLVKILDVFDLEIKVVEKAK